MFTEINDGAKIFARSIESWSQVGKTERLIRDMTDILPHAKSSVYTGNIGSIIYTTSVLTGS